MTADDKYSLVNKDILKQHIRMPLPEKQKAFSEFFSRFMKSALNFEYFQKKRWLSDVFLKLLTPKNVVR